MTRVFRGLYAGSEYWAGLGPKARVLHLARSLSDAHPNWVFCGPTAAVVHGLEISYAYLNRIHASCPNVGRSSSESLVWHWLPHERPTRVGGIPVTSVARTAFDCMRYLPFSRGLAIADSYLRMSGSGRGDLREALELWGGSDNLNQAKVTLSFADGRSENGGESCARAAMIELGYQIPELQVEVPNEIEGGMFRVDFLWDLPGGRSVAGELDGWGKYLAEDVEKSEGATSASEHAIQTMTAERLRESRLSRRLEVMRFSYQQARDLDYMLRLLEGFGVPRASCMRNVDVRRRLPRWVSQSGRMT
ncbi:hypothetical protein [Olsenella sp. HMSC062G07]|uniref:hypothetical protein n=1 Tax=Olsenella sp. HMSC062G07 TaxID=1739330 RepID=UPI000AE7188C|nr:hypothetical protein [Olsenella sp. HMSC062G07]